MDTCLKCLISHDIKDVYLYMYVSCVYIAPTKLISKLVLGTRSPLASHSKDHPSQVSPIKSSYRFADMAVTRAIHQILPRKTRRTSQSPSNVDACRFINSIWYFNLTRVWNLHLHNPRNHPSRTFQEIANLWNHHLRSLLSRSIQSLPSGTSGTFQEIMNFQWLYNLNIPQERLKPSNPKAPEASIDLRNLRDLPIVPADFHLRPEQHNTSEPSRTSEAVNCLRNLQETHSQPPQPAQGNPGPEPIVCEEAP